MPTIAAATRTDSGLASQLRVSVVRLSRRLRAERDPANPLSVGAISVLGVLIRNGECTVGQLAAHERVQPPSMTRTVNALAEDGYVVRRASETDGRVVLIELSDKGRQTLLADRRRRDEWLARRLADLTPDERALLRQVAPLIERLASDFSPTFRALRIRNYRLYALGGVVSNTGTWMQRVAQDWLVLTLHHGSAAEASTALGVTTALQFLPILLFSPYAGLVADRMPKRRLLQLTQAWMGLVALALAGLALTGVVQSWMVFVLAFAFGLGAAFDAPARQSFVSEMVGPDDLSNAVGLNSASFNLGRVVGPALSGSLIALLGSGVRATGAVIALNGLSYLAVIGALRLMRESELAPSDRAPRGKGMIRDGIRYVRSRPDLKMVLVAGFFAGTFGMNFQMTSALMATQIFHKGPGEYGLLGTTMACGSLTAALLGARRVARPRPQWVIVAGLTFGTIEIALGLMPTYLTFALCTPLLGLSLLTMLNSANTTVQLTTDPSMRGRVMALYMMVVMGGTPLGAPIVGWVGAAFGARWTLIGGGALSVFGVLLAAALFGGAYRPARWRRPTEAEADAVNTLAI